MSQVTLITTAPKSQRSSMSRTCYFLLCLLWLSLGPFWAASFLQNQNDGASGRPLECWPPSRWAPPLEEGSDNWLLWHKVAHFPSLHLIVHSTLHKKLEVQPCRESREQRVTDNCDHWWHPCCPHMPGRLLVRCRFTIAPRWPGHSHSRVGYLDQHLIQCLIVCDKGYWKHIGGGDMQTFL